MTNSILFLDEVKIDITDSKEFYKSKRNGLEIEFSIAIENEINRIILSPKLYQIRYRNIRIAHPKIFPYNIHFYFDETVKLIVITAIVHNKRHQNILERGL